MQEKHKVLVITPIKHIEAVFDGLKDFADITYMPEAGSHDVAQAICDQEALFTNPNKSKVFIGKQIMDSARRLLCICTASTGTNHIELDYAKSHGIAVLALTEERETINKISSTAEHAFALTLAALRKVPQGFQSVRQGSWNYEPFIGRQFDYLTVGVIGYGRLGRYYSRYCSCLGAKVTVYDPYKTVGDDRISQVKDLDELITTADIISLHVHVTEETLGLINEALLAKMKSSVLIVNTSRGDVVNESNLVDFLEKNPEAGYATDVLAREITNKEDSAVLEYAMKSDQVLITPHIGGMTVEGQYIAYNRAVSLLREYFSNMGAEQPVGSQSRMGRRI